MRIKGNDDQHSPKAGIVLRPTSQTEKAPSWDFGESKQKRVVLVMGNNQQQAEHCYGVKELS